MKHYCRSQILAPKGIGNGIGERSRPQRLELSHFRPEMGQLDLCESPRAMSSHTAQATTPTTKMGQFTFVGGRAELSLRITQEAIRAIQAHANPSGAQIRRAA